MYPGSTWNSLIQAKAAYPNVTIIAIINIDNGPGASPDSNYAAWVNDLRAANIITIGYVYTDYAARSASSVEADIQNYSKFGYQISGIFFDEMSEGAGNESYYSTLNSYAKSLGYGLTIGNMGIDGFPSSYIGTMQDIVAYENPGLPALSRVAGWDTEYGTRNLSYIAYGISSLNTTYVSESSNYVQYIYITSGSGSNPYDILPSYLDGMVSTLNN
jgi:hypothetical protein